MVVAQIKQMDRFIASMEQINVGVSKQRIEKQILQSVLEKLKNSTALKEQLGKTKVQLCNYIAVSVLEEIKHSSVSEGEIHRLETALMREVQRKLMNGNNKKMKE